MKAMERYCAQPNPVLVRITNAIIIFLRYELPRARSAPRTTTIAIKPARVHRQWPILLLKRVRRSAPNTSPRLYGRVRTMA
jgi:hypothetical protein